MIELRTSQLAPDVANLLLLRGTDLPPLLWGQRPVRAAKDMLTAIDGDEALFKRSSIADEAAAAAVRALLYLWNGWLDDCDMFAQGAAPPDRCYLLALTARHAGKADATKTHFQQIEEYPIHAPLARYAIEVIGPGADPALRRFRQLLEMTSQWEPFMFADLFELARAGKFNHTDETLVRQLQCREFELLLVNGYERATGSEIPHVCDPQPKKRRRPVVQSKRRSQPVIAVDAASKKLDPKKVRPVPLRPSTNVLIACPKCDFQKLIPAAMRGKATKCEKCQVAFRVPQQKTPQPTAGTTKR